MKKNKKSINRVRVGWVTEHDIKDGKNPFYDNDYAGGSLEVVQNTAPFIKSKKLKRPLSCPAEHCSKMYSKEIESIYYYYKDFKWSGLLVHMMEWHGYEPPRDFCRFLDEMLTELEFMIVVDYDPSTMAIVNSMVEKDEEKVLREYDAIKKRCKERKAESK